MISYWRPALAMHAVKFAIIPSSASPSPTPPASRRSEHADLLRIMFIEAGTPRRDHVPRPRAGEALNTDLANACWLATNLSAIALAPLWLYIASRF